MKIKVLYNKIWRSFLNIGSNENLQSKRKKVFNQMATKAKNVELTEAFIEAFSSVVTTQSNF